MDGVTTIHALVDLLANGLTGLFAAAKLQLATNSFIPSPNTLPADVTLPTLTGYVDKAVAYDSPGYDGSLGMAVVNGTLVYQWSGPADATGQQITNWALTQPGAAGPPIVPNVILASGTINPPMPLLLPTDRISLALTVLSNGVVSVTVLG